MMENDIKKEFSLSLFLSFSTKVAMCNIQIVVHLIQDRHKHAYMMENDIKKEYSLSLSLSLSLHEKYTHVA